MDGGHTPHAAQAWVSRALHRPDRRPDGHTYICSRQRSAANCFCCWSNVCCAKRTGGRIRQKVRTQMRGFWTKITSRKFLAALVGIITGLAMVFGLNEKTLSRPSLVQLWRWPP